jgi:hypothetical protein
MRRARYLLLIPVAIIAAAFLLEDLTLNFGGGPVLVRSYRPTGPDDGTTENITLKAQSAFNRETNRRYTRTWELNVPRSYISQVNGSRWLGTSSVFIHMIHSTGEFEILPEPPMFQSTAEHSILYIILFDKIAGNSKHGICEDEQDVRENMGRPPALSVMYPPVRDCNTKNCSYYMSYEGWYVRIMVDRQLYLRKEKYCSLSHDLLSKWTVKIEPLNN